MIAFLRVYPKGHSAAPCTTLLFTLALLLVVANPSSLCHRAQASVEKINHTHTNARDNPRLVAVLIGSGSDSFGSTVTKLNDRGEIRNRASVVISRFDPDHDSNLTLTAAAV